MLRINAQYHSDHSYARLKVFLDPFFLEIYENLKSMNECYTSPIRFFKFVGNSLIIRIRDHILH